MRAMLPRSWPMPCHTMARDRPAQRAAQPARLTIRLSAMQTSWYSGAVKLASVIASLVCVCVGLAVAAGSLSSRSGEVAPPVVTNEPDEFVMRDVRRDAATRLGCQGPMVSVRTTQWAGSEGNVVAIGCGHQINYYLRCLTN